MSSQYISVKVTKELINEGGQSFKEGSEIAFNYYGDRVICLLKRIHRKKGYITVKDVEINGSKHGNKYKFLISGITDLKYTNYD